MKLNLFLKLSLLLSLPVVCFARNNEIPLESDATPHLRVSNEQIDENYDLEQDIEQIESEIEETKHNTTQIAKHCGGF